MRLFLILLSVTLSSTTAFALNAAPLSDANANGSDSAYTQPRFADVHKWCRGGPGQPPTYECESGRR